MVFLAFRAVRHETRNQTSPAQTSSSAGQSSFDLSYTPLATRAIFRYSIVPGGVRNQLELQKAAASDPLVARHYSDFCITQARTIRFDHPLAMYVSYRRNNQVYWTKNRMLIPAGETLITDGENLARVRCANRLSSVALKPVAAVDPGSDDLNDPLFVPPLLAGLPPIEEMHNAEGVAGPFPEPIIPPGPSASTVAPPIFPPILPPGVPPFRFESPVPPPVNAPEPRSTVLLCAGLPLLSLALFLSRRQ